MVDDRRHNLGQWITRLSGRALNSIDLLFKKGEKPLSEGQIVVDADRVVYIAGLLDDTAKTVDNFPRGAIPIAVPTVKYPVPVIPGAEGKLFRQQALAGGTEALTIDLTVATLPAGSGPALVLLDRLKVVAALLTGAETMTITVVDGPNEMGMLVNAFSFASTGKAISLPYKSQEAALAADNLMQWEPGTALILYEGEVLRIVTSSIPENDGFNILLDYRSLEGVELTATISGAGTIGDIP